ncbi:MAG: PilN domain-containing protein [Bdellovibrionota bacterium]
MIKINLAKKRKAANATTLTDIKSLNVSTLIAILKGGGDGGSKLDLRGPIPKIAIALVVCWFVSSTVEEIERDAVKKIDDQIHVIESERAEIQRKLDRIKGFEPLKRQLEEDEVAIRTKLECVTKLMENRNAPSRMMMHIAQVIPEDMWLTEFRVSPDVVRLEGATPGYNQVSDFIKALNGTSQFGEINLSGIQENVSAEKDQKFQTFELEAKRRQVQ